MKKRRVRDHVLVSAEPSKQVAVDNLVIEPTRVPDTIPYACVNAAVYGNEATSDDKNDPQDELHPPTLICALRMFRWGRYSGIKGSNPRR